MSICPLAQLKSIAIEKGQKVPRPLFRKGGEAASERTRFPTITIDTSFLQEKANLLPLKSYFLSRANNLEDSASRKDQFVWRLLSRPSGRPGRERVSC